MHILQSVIFVVFFAACNGFNTGDKKSISPAGYDLDRPEKIKPGKGLDEISGIAFNDAMQKLMAVNDEDGKLFSISLKGEQTTNSTKFAGKGDYEDIVYTGNDYYVLKSNGDIYRLKYIFTDSASHEKFAFPHPGNEFEGIFFNNSSNKLFVLCKSCKKDASSKEVSLFSFDLATMQWSSDAAFQIDVRQISDLLKTDKLIFKPSAIAVHPFKKQLYILSGVNKLLVTAGMDGIIKEAFILNPSLFKQPEGICFANNGDMYISNEAGDLGSADILLFPYQNTSATQ